MSITSKIHPCTLGPDGMALIGRTRNDLRGLRFAENDGGNTAGGENNAGTGAAGAADAGAAAGGDAGTGAGAAGATAWDGKIESLDPGVQKIITDLRSEAAGHRTGKNTAEQNLKDLTDRLGVQLGFKQDEAADPAKLTESLTKAQQDARNASLQLAVYKAAGANGANPDALLDSNTFLASVKDLDPTGADFGTKVSEAIKTAVAANTTLKQARAAGPSTTDNPGGDPGLITEAQLATMTPEQIDKAFNEGKLKHLLG